MLERAPVRMPGPLMIKSGDVLCSEPLRPCWELATHAYATAAGFEITCPYCSREGARSLPIRETSAPKET